jgi:uncharacterized protein
MKNLKPILCTLALLLAGSAVASDKLLDSLKHRDGQQVYDHANVIPAGQEQQLEALLTGLERQTGDSVVVVTLPSLEGGERADFANRLYARWGIGKKGKDNGVLLLAAIQDHQAQIEVGYGLEGTINDALAVRILREEVFPRFKQQHYAEGLTAASARIVNLIAEERGIELSGAQPYRGHGSQEAKKPNLFVTIIFIIGFIYMAIRHPQLLILLMLSSGRGGSRGGGGGFGGGGGGGFGGGMSGGGGGGGSW